MSQPEIPAWLETLKAGEQRPPAEAAPFSPGELLDEGALPGWMRAQRGEEANTSITNPHRQAAFSSQPAVEGTGMQKGFEARSLIDERSLPGWMQSPEAAAPGEPGQLAPGSLIDAEALPEWMKSMSEPSTPSVPSIPASSMSPVEQQPSLQGSQQMPEWMKSLHSASQMQQAAPVPPIAAPQPSFEAQIPASQNGFSAKDLVDEKVLPSWMKQTNPSSQPGDASSVSSQPGMLSPGSLIDESSLPGWMKQGDQPAQTGNVNIPGAVQANPVEPGKLSPASLIDASSLPPWMREQSAPASSPLPPTNAPAMPNIQPSQAGSSISASSFVDTNALPDWLKSAAGHYQSDQTQQPGLSQQRPENMRVPSRPRREMNPNEGSEAAANVFASMLGVASSTPQYPGPSQSGSYANQGPSGAPQPSQSGYLAGQQPSQPGYMASQPSQPGYMGGQMSQPGYLANQPSQPGYVGSNSSQSLPPLPQSYPGMNAMQPPQPGYMSEMPRQPSQGGAYGGGYQQNNNMQGYYGQGPQSMQPDMHGSQRGSKKRSLFERFLDLFKSDR
jgi:hypothetical protein